MTLKKFEVSKQERKELLGIIGSLRKDIVEASLVGSPYGHPLKKVEWAATTTPPN